jgi:regulator of sirC expression with transglutaminase-like and TPR domain
LIVNLFTIAIVTPVAVLRFTNYTCFMEIDKDHSKEIKAIVQLLDDQDPEIFGLIRNKLLSLGKPVVPALEEVWERSIDSMLQERIETIIHEIHFEGIKRELAEWQELYESDLLKGSVIIARYQYPDLEEKKVTRYLEQIYKDVALEIEMVDTPIEKIRVINHAMFDIHRFLGNRQNYHAPTNNYINHVLESKKGNHLLLSVIYILVARHFKLPVYGVNLPENFIMCYVEKDPLDLLNTQQPKVKFYLNTFAKGAIFSEREVDQFLNQLKRAKKPEYYVPCNHTTILLRMITNLISAYQKIGMKNKVHELIDLRQILDDEQTNSL